MRVLLDTCCIVWAISELDKLSKSARNLLLLPDADIYAIKSPGLVILTRFFIWFKAMPRWVSVISCAEIACSAQLVKGRPYHHSLLYI